MQQRPAVTIRRFRPEDAQVVRKLVIDGLRSTGPDLRNEVWKSQTLYGRLVKAGSVVLPAIALAALSKKPPVTQLAGFLASALAMPAVVYGYVHEFGNTYINKSLKEDLADIPGTYDTGDGSAFWVAECDGKVVGCVGLHQRSHTKAELRRMSADGSMRGQGVGRLLCQELIDHARKQGFKVVFLTTTSGQYAALALYQKMGWTVVKVFEPHLMKHVMLKLTL